MDCKTPATMMIRRDQPITARGFIVFIFISMLLPYARRIGSLRADHPEEGRLEQGLGQRAHPARDDVGDRAAPCNFLGDDSREEMLHPALAGRADDDEVVLHCALE